MWIGLALLPVAAVAAIFGFVVRRWSAVAVAVAVWPVWFLGLNRGWWGHGVGDGWKHSMYSLTIVSAGGAALGILIRR